MNELSIFQHEQFGALPVIVWEGVEYFDPDVVAAALGHKDADDMLRVFKNIPEEDRNLYVKHFTFKELSQLRIERGVEQNQYVTFSPNGKRFLTEPGLFYILNRSDKPNAYPFQKWVNTVVLPQLRKEGRYALKPQNPLEVTDLADKLMLFMETVQANQLAMKEDLQQIKRAQLTIKKDQSIIKEQVKVQQQKTDALFQRLQALHLHLTNQHQDDRKIVQDKVHQASQQVIEKTAENLLTLEKNVKRNVKKNLIRVAASLDEVIYQDIIINKQLRTILALLKTQSKAAKGYSAESKANLRETMLLMREHLDASDQTIAEELNRDSIPTLTSKGEWTALKVKRFLSS